MIMRAMYRFQIIVLNDDDVEEELFRWLLSQLFKGMQQTKTLRRPFIIFFQWVGRSRPTSSRPVHCGGSLAVVLSQFFAIQISCAIKLLNDVPFRERKLGRGRRSCEKRSRGRSFNEEGDQYFVMLWD